MNHQRQKTSQSNHEENVKSRSHDSKYLNYRSYKPKCVQSKVAGYIKNKPRRDSQTKRNCTRTIRSAGSSEIKHVTSDSDHNMKLPSADADSKKSTSRRHAKKEEAEVKKPKLDTKIQTDSRKSNNSEARTKNQHKKYKTFDIASFPRVFSTSDLMDRMNEVDDDARNKCTFENINNANMTTKTTTPSTDKEEQRLRNEFENIGVNIELLPQNTVPEEDNFEKCASNEHDFLPNVDSAIIFSGNTIGDVNILQREIHDLEEKLLKSFHENQTKDDNEKKLISELNEIRLCVQRLENQNNVLKDDIQKREEIINELRESLRALEEESRKNVTLKQTESLETGRLQQRLMEQESLLENLLQENAKLKECVEEKYALEDRLNQYQEKFFQQEEQNEHICSLQEQLQSTKEQMICAKQENEKLKETNALSLDEINEYKIAILRLKEIISKQKTSLKLLEDVKQEEAKKLNTYEVKNTQLRDVNRNLLMEIEKFKTEKKRLLKVIALNQILSVGETCMFENAHQNCFSNGLQHIQKTNTKSNKKNPLEEIKTFKASISKTFNSKPRD